MDYQKVKAMVKVSQIIGAKDIVLSPEQRKMYARNIWLDEAQLMGCESQGEVDFCIELEDMKNIMGAYSKNEVEEIGFAYDASLSEAKITIELKDGEKEEHRLAGQPYVVEQSKREDLKPCWKFNTCLANILDVVSRLSNVTATSEGRSFRFDKAILSIHRTDKKIKQKGHIRVVTTNAAAAMLEILEGEIEMAENTSCYAEPEAKVLTSILKEMKQIYKLGTLYITNYNQGQWTEFKTGNLSVLMKALDFNKTPIKAIEKVIAEIPEKIANAEFMFYMDKAIMMKTAARMRKLKKSSEPFAFLCKEGEKLYMYSSDEKHKLSLKGFEEVVYTANGHKIRISADNLEKVLKAINGDRVKIFTSKDEGELIFFETEATTGMLAKVIDK